MDIVIKAKHWQVFGAMVLLMVVKEILGFSSELMEDITYTIFVAANVGWIMILGTVLRQRAKNVVTANYSLFLGTGLLMIVFVGAFRLLLTYEETEEIMESGIFMGAFFTYAIISFAILYSFPVKILKSVEMKEEAGINNYFNDIFLLLCWPIGIWFIQPRLNKIEQTLRENQ